MTETTLVITKSRSQRREGWMGLGMGLTLIAAALLSMGGTSVKSSNGSSASVSAAAAIDSAPSQLAEADRDSLDLQLD